MTNTFAIKGALLNAICPVVPDTLSDVIYQTTCCLLTPDEILSFSTALRLFANYANCHAIPYGAHCNIVYLDSNSITIDIKQLPAKPYGASIKVVPIYLHQVRDLSQRSHVQQTAEQIDVMRYQILLEELFHSLYNICNEYIVKELVFRAIFSANCPIEHIAELYTNVFLPDGTPNPVCYTKDYLNYQNDLKHYTDLFA